MPNPLEVLLYGTAATAIFVAFITATAKFKILQVFVFGVLSLAGVLILLYSVGFLAMLALGKIP